jgi:integration host factor subunit alpha
MISGYHLKKGDFIMALTKAEIVDSISDQIGFPKSHSFEIIETLLEIMKKTLESCDDVMISNFGKFCVKEKRERRGRDPSTGQEMILKPRKVVTFKCSGTLREKING